MAEQSEKVTSGDLLKSVPPPTPFLTKTYQLVNDESSDHVISWNEDGSSFIVWNTATFARDLLPKYFKHNNFTSFLRQLNTYGFRKVASDRWEFSNECFRKGKKQLLCEIQRRKMSSPVSSTLESETTVSAAGIPLPGNCSKEEVIKTIESPSPTRILAELIDENARLKKEKVQLTEQLIKMKSLCNNIFTLMSNFAENHSKRSFNVSEKISTSMKSFNLFPVKQSSPANDAEAMDAVERNLNNAPLGTKRARKRMEGYGTSLADDTTLRLQPP